jgi:hypothetical protein
MICARTAIGIRLLLQLLGHSETSSRESDIWRKADIDRPPRPFSIYEYAARVFFACHRQCERDGGGKPPPSKFSDADKVSGPPTTASSGGHRPGGNPPRVMNVVVALSVAISMRFAPDFSDRSILSQEGMPTRQPQLLLTLLPRCYLEQVKRSARFQRTV